jgi:hypothetical protein
MEMRLYFCSYWLPFPSSEYGGVVNIIAKDEDNAKEEYYKWVTEGDPYVSDDWPNVKTLIANCVSNSLSVPIDTQSYKGNTGVIYSFLT